MNIQTLTDPFGGFPCIHTLDRPLTYVDGLVLDGSGAEIIRTFPSDNPAIHLSGELISLRDITFRECAECESSGFDRTPAIFGLGGKHIEFREVHMTNLARFGAVLYGVEDVIFIQCEISFRPRPEQARFRDGMVGVFSGRYMVRNLMMEYCRFYGRDVGDGLLVASYGDNIKVRNCQLDQ